jgi:hypothetical protein
MSSKVLTLLTCNLQDVSNSLFRCDPQTGMINAFGHDAMDVARKHQQFIESNERTILGSEEKERPLVDTTESGTLDIKKRQSPSFLDKSIISPLRNQGQVFSRLAPYLSFTIPLRQGYRRLKWKCVSVISHLFHGLFASCRI